jgi:hypothetical protein
MTTLTGHAGQAEAQAFTGLEEPDAAANSDFAQEHAGDAYEDAAEALAASRAHVDDLRADLDDAAHSAPARGDDPYARETTGGSAKTYYDPDHEAAQRDSLAFAADEDEFAEDEDGQDWSDYADADAAEYHVAEDRNRAALQHDGHASMSARPDDTDDDALLAEYDFGEEAVEDRVPPEIAAQQSRRGPGILIVGAAWALFLAILAGAGWSALSFRERIVEALPASEPLYAAIGFPVSQTPLALEDVSYALKGQPANVLTLTGRVKHNGSSLIEMPNLKITVRDEAEETVLEDSRFLGKAALLPGESMEFEVDLDVPAERLRTVELKF